MNSNSTIKTLKSGNHNFINNALTHNFQDSDRRKDVANAQNPFAVILTCSDSRVIPELIFDCGIGELFVIRIAGNIANTSSIASIEYAVKHLGVNLVVVMAHQNCGAVTAATKSEDHGTNLNHLLLHIHPALGQSQNAQIDEIAKINAKLTAEELIARSKTLATAISNVELKIVSAYYNLDTGKVDFLE